MSEEMIFAYVENKKYPRGKSQISTEESCRLDSRMLLPPLISNF